MLTRGHADEVHTQRVPADGSYVARWCTGRAVVVCKVAISLTPNDSLPPAAAAGFLCNSCEVEKIKRLCPRCAVIDESELVTAWCHGEFACIPGLCSGTVCPHRTPVDLACAQH